MLTTVFLAKYQLTANPIGTLKVPYSLLSLKKNLFLEEKYTRFQEIKEVTLAWKVV